jgi:rhodanese-related sulfurtransferase
MKNFLTTMMAIFLFLSISVSAKEPIQYQTFENDVQVIDVRSDSEWKDGHHPNAQHLLHTTILDGKGFADLDKTKPVVLYCRSGGRAERAKNYLQAQGFINVKNLEGISDLIIEQKGQE